MFIDKYNDFNTYLVKNCSGTRGYNCGNTCISRQFVCRIDGLSGQAIEVMSNLDTLRINAQSDQIDKQRATEIGQQIRQSGYKLPIQVKGSVVRLIQGRDGIIEVNKGKIKTYKLKKSIREALGL